MVQRSVPPPERRRPKTGPAVIARYLKTLPGSPGVYRMLDAGGNVIYVGKARSLKARVSNYARAGNHTNRIARMIAATAAMEFVTVRTEAEALLLEANLIKRFRPRFNVLMRDDKSFPYILIARDHAGAADPEASRRAQPQGRLLRAVRLGRRRQPHHQHAGARVPAALLLGQRLREPHAALPAAIRSSAARRRAPARSRLEDYGALVDEAVRFLRGESQNVRADVPAADGGGGRAARVRAGGQVPQPPVGAGARHRRPVDQPRGHRGGRRVRRPPGGRADLHPGVLLPHRARTGATAPTSRSADRSLPRRGGAGELHRPVLRRQAGAAAASCCRTTCPNRELLAEALSHQGRAQGRDPRAAARRQDRHRRARAAATRARRWAAGWPKAPRSAACWRACTSASGWRARRAASRCSTTATSRAPTRSAP